MSKAALFDAVTELDVAAVQAFLKRKPDLRNATTEKGLNLLQLACTRDVHDDAPSAARQLTLVEWLIAQGFDPHVTHTTKPGEDGEAEPTTLPLTFFAVARARNDRLTRALLARGVKSEGLFAAVWWANWRILPDLVQHGAAIDVVVGATPLHMAVQLLDRGVEADPRLGVERRKVVQTLLELGADPNVPDQRGDTPLHLALAKASDPSVVSLLLAHGASADTPGRDGRTARAIAARKRDRRYIAAIEAPRPSRR